MLKIEKKNIKTKQNKKNTTGLSVVVLRFTYEFDYAFTKNLSHNDTAKFSARRPSSKKCQSD